jgi:hypothetical protein
MPLSAAGRPDGLIRTPGGRQNFRGIPFWLGQEGVQNKSWVVLSRRPSPSATGSVLIPLEGRASFICLAQFCDWDESESPPPAEDVVERVGQPLAEAVLVYEDGSERALPIRRRFEVNSPSIFWGHLCFAALPHLKDAPRKLNEPLPDGTQWGGLQTSVWDNAYSSNGPDGRLVPLVWVCALANPEPERFLKALRLQATADDFLIVCGLTLYHGPENPLRYDRLSLYRITLPEPTAEEEKRWGVSVDLGVVARTYVLDVFDSEVWLSTPRKGLGEANRPARGVPYLYAEVTASPGATLTLTDTKTGKKYEFDLGKVFPSKELEARPEGARLEILEAERVWLRGRVVDAATGHPTPVRLAFRSKEGRYIPSRGHRTEINDAWFQDYGADLKVMDTSYAYVDGTFQVELPVGDVYLEMTKGFEYGAVRKKLKIDPGQRELNLEISHHLDLRSKGWVRADTHVHFLSPSTAILEGQAEGLNLINLLAAQWGDLFTNVGDVSQGPLVSRDRETVLRVGTENRQHLLGHLSLLGGRGEPAYPLSAGGPGESYLGDPLWTTLAEWADACRKREGLVVAPHFPYPVGEIAADVVLGKIDAVELFPYGENFNALRFYDWYRYLNCGYRLPVVGGTDKMSASMPVGANRTYAYLGQEEFSFENWAKAIRKGNTFMTTAPLLLFHADGRMPGDEIILGAGGGSIEVQVDARSFVPFHHLEVVFNGRVVASHEDQTGTREMALKERLQVPGPGWLAARCKSQLGPTTAFGLALLAHTSPIYVHVPGDDLFSPSAATYMMTLIEGAETWAENLAARPDPETFARVRKVFVDARHLLERRLSNHGVHD